MSAMVAVISLGGSGPTSPKQRIIAVVCVRRSMGWGIVPKPYRPEIAHPLEVERMLLHGTCLALLVVLAIRKIGVLSLGSTMYVGTATAVLEGFLRMSSRLT